jgi:DNA-binding CsgD family transcriptional regulator
MTNGADCRADALVTEELSVSPKTAGRAAPALPFNVPAETRLHAKGIPAELLAGIEQLSRREREVLRLLLNNQRPRTIAQTLFISLYTVRNHLRSIFEKFAVHSQAELLTMLGQYTSYVDLQDAV